MSFCFLRARPGLIALGSLLLWSLPNSDFGGERFLTPTEKISTFRVGQQLFEEGRYQEAIVLLKKRLGQAGTTDNEEFEFYRELALFFFYADQLQDSMESFRMALQLAAKASSRADIASIKEEIALEEYYAQGIRFRKNGDFSSSDQSFRKACAKSRAIGSQPHELKILRTWSFNYIGSQDTIKTYLDLNNQAMKIALEIDNKVEACASALSIGAYYALNNDYSRALSYYLKALFYVRELPSNDDTVVCLNNIGTAYVSLGDYSKAYDYVSEATKLAIPGHATPIQPALLINLGEIFRSLAQTHEVSEYYNRALECFTASLQLTSGAAGQDLSLYALNGLAGLYSDRAEFHKASSVLMPALERVRAANSPSLFCITKFNLGEISLGKGDLTGAEVLFGEGLAAAKQSGNLMQRIIGLYDLGRCLEQRGNYRGGLSNYTEAVNLICNGGFRIVNDVSHAEFIYRSYKVYQALIELHFRMYKESHIQAFETEIFRISEMFRARSFLDFLFRKPHQTINVSLIPNEPVEEKLNNERLYLLNGLSQPSQQEKKYEELQAKIRHIDDTLDSMMFDRFRQQTDSAPSISPISVDFLQHNLLEPRTGLIEYFLGEKRSFVFCISKDSFHMKELPSSRFINDSLIAYLSFLEDPSIPASKGIAAAQRLYAMLLLPIANFIPSSVNHLIIVPDGILYRLPFETLIISADTSSPATHLYERYVISYSPTAAALSYHKMRPKPKYKKDVLAFGISEYPAPARGAKEPAINTAYSVLKDLYQRAGLDLAPLPYSREEVRSLATRVKSGNADVYYGQGATEDAFKSLDLRAYRVIHLACHAFSDEKYPLRSCLAFCFANDSKEDGFLQASEIYKMHTDADLVTLSACESGKGMILGNEGAMGLPRVIFYAGARSVISTLWTIDDKASAIFMGLFYDQYFRGIDKATALQIAKQKMAKTRYNHPYYWASYVLTGEY